MTEERRAINEVRDKPAETSARLLVVVTTIAVGLIAYFGDRAIDKLDQIGDTLAGLVVFVKTNSAEISSLKNTDKEILIKVDGISERVYKLEGVK